LEGSTGPWEGSADLGRAVRAWEGLSEPGKVRQGPGRALQSLRGLDRALGAAMCRSGEREKGKKEEKETTTRVLNALVSCRETKP